MSHAKTALFTMFAIVIGMSGSDALHTFTAMIGAAFIVDGLD